MSLCIQCRSACSFDAPGGNSTRKELVEHHVDLVTLRLSSASCDLCCMIESQIKLGEFWEDCARGDEASLFLQLEREATPQGYALLRPLVWCKRRSSFVAVPSLVVTHGNFEQAPFLKRAIWNNRGLEDRLSTVKDWLHTCISEHGDGSCRVSLSGARSVLPARVLDLGPPGHEKWPKVVETFGITAPYVTLSYCWGRASKFVASRSNIPSLRQGVDPSLLSRTFRDAILVVNALGLRYLWIDALCILQDDPTEVEREVANMASIYRKALMTIVVDAASGADEGCFPTIPQTLFVAPDTNLTSATYQNGLTKVRPRPQYQKTVLESPLRTRGWTLQEDLLSMRTLHCAADQMYWQCGKHVCSEDGIIDLSPFDSWKLPANVPSELALGDYYGNSMRLTTKNPKVYQRLWNLATWYLMVGDYTGRSLSYPADKLAAIAGLTKVFELWNGTESIAGLWLTDLHFGLTWRAAILKSACSLPAAHGIPSWSWVSFDGPVRYEDTRVFQESRAQVNREFQILDSHIEWSGQPLSSTITRATLSLGAKMRRLVVQIDDVGDSTIVITRCKPQLPFSNITNTSIARGSFQATATSEVPSDLSIGNANTRFKPHAVAELDRAVPEGSHTFFALLLHSPVSWKRNDMPSTCAFLLVESTGTKREYRRVGVGQAAVELFLFEDVGWENVVLV
ncbi:heterokaryon incompatibility protein-domain-containing protein [Phyllosticta capitalensis]|uniref:Heterokaryon incompatibility protein-domain-containing protein n=1 Tax=Phyllosticta capitalensis TaxID=121624 RepID=A0ABR1YWZ6_9PEZI